MDKDEDKSIKKDEEERKKLLQLKRRVTIRKVKGKLIWQGNLDGMRIDTIISS